MNIIAIMCWRLWKLRNDLVLSKKGSSVAEFIVLARSFLDQWTRAQDKNVIPITTFMTAADGSEKWVKPEVDTVKINVDAALYKSGTYSFLGIARNATREVVEAITSCRTCHIAPKMAEAMGVREALS